MVGFYAFSRNNPMRRSLLAAHDTIYGVIMKKYLIAFLLSLSCALAVTAVGCTQNPENNNDNSQSSSDVVYTGESTVRFEQGEGFRYDSATKDGGVISNGNYLEFKIDLGGFYLDSVPVVYVNDTPISHDGSGNYRVLVKEDLQIRVENVKKDVSNMSGSGSFEDPFVVTKPIDLIYIADKVNSGDRNYVQGAYVLAADIDCKGEELKVIGDSSTENSYFSGCFVCNYDSETGDLYDYSISNFKINSKTSNYVGLFGTVYADLSVQSSGLFYGVKLENFTIEASLSPNHTEDSKTITCGGLIGYGVGANMYLCSATDGEINVTADEYYFSYVGGLIGYQQAFYSPEYDYHFASDIAYCYTDLDISVFGGKVLGAGGLVGYMTSNYPTVSVASVHNSYALGDVSGALRCGGLVGTMGRYAVVSNCYASGTVFASCNIEQNDTAWPDEYKFASAGGLVGYAENDTIAHDSFFNGEVDAYAAAGNTFTYTHHAIGHGDPAGYASATAQKYIAWDENCLYNIDLSNKDYLTETLGWAGYDWVFTENKLPAINYAATESSTTLAFTLKYVANGQPFSVKGVTETTLTYFNSQSQSSNSYATMGSFLEGGGLPYYYAYDTTTDGYRAFGYFFDAECTLRVPNGYMPMRNVTLYVGFEKVTPIVGTYYFTTTEYDKALTLEFREDGILRYSDGLTFQEAYYAYDGAYIYVDGARFARYYDGAIITDDETADPNFDLNRYMYYDFRGEVKDGTLSLYDTTYFVDEPFTATLTQPTLESYDNFKGVWTKSANVNKTYVFDGKGNWTFTQTEYTRAGNYYGYVATATTVRSANGTYEVINDGDAIRFVDGNVTYTATFNDDGFLQIVGGNLTQTYYREESYVGTWTAAGITLSLQGVQADGTGLLTLTYADGTTYNYVYEKSETDGYVAIYYPHASYWKNDLFGYFYYDVNAHTLVASLYSTDSGEAAYVQYAFRALDEYAGEWITDEPTLTQTVLLFDGNGLYSHENKSGKLTIIDNNGKTEISYTLNARLQGTFLYNGNRYDISYDEDAGKIIVNTTAEMLRKDELAGYVFLDEQGNEYVFNGKGNLQTENSGVLTVNGETTYPYTQINGANGDVSHYEIRMNGTPYTLTKTQTHYALAQAGGSVTELYIQNEFMGEWAMYGAFETLTIGATQLDGVIRGKFHGAPITLTVYDNDVLTFFYMEGKQPHTYYLYIIFDEYIQDDILILSEYNSLYAGDDWVYCSKKHNMFGTWVWNKNSQMTLSFDGFQSGYTTYAAGTAKQSWNDAPTYYYYVFKGENVLMWSFEPLANKYWYYSVRIVTEQDADFEQAKADKNAWYNTENNTVIIREEVDNLCFTEAVDEDGNEYVFDGKGNVLMNGEVKYNYFLDYVESDDKTNTKHFIVLDVTDGKYYELTLDHSYSIDAENILLSVGEETTNPNA